MTNGWDMLPPTCCNPGARGENLLLLLVAAAVLVGGHFAYRWFKKRKKAALVKSTKNIAPPRRAVHGDDGMVGKI